MPDREKVIKGLEYCGKGCNSDCPYWEQFGFGDGGCLSVMRKDALALLKEQETVKPKTGRWICLQYCANEGVYCSECHTKMFDRYPMKKKLSQFCGHCGAKMGDEVEGR